MPFEGDKSKVLTGPFDVTINGVVVGHTEENVQLLQIGEAETRHNSHEAGPNVPVKITRAPRQVRIEIRSLQIQANLLEEVFAEATVSASGTVTVAQDSLTVLDGVTIVLHPTEFPTLTTDHDHTFSNMANVGPPLDQPAGREDRFMLNMFFEGLWVDTGSRYVLKGFANPA